MYLYIKQRFRVSYSSNTMPLAAYWSGLYLSYQNTRCEETSFCGRKEEEAGANNPF
jgi:hypothetical protein